MKDFKVAALFPTPFYMAKLDDEFCDIAKELETQEVMHDDAEEEIYEGWGYVGKDTYVLNNAKYEKLRKELLKHVQFFSNEILCHDINKVLMSQSWVSKKEKGQAHGSHHHGNSYISGVFYWQDDIMPIVIEKPADMNTMLYPFNQNLQHVVEARPVQSFEVSKGMLVLFESHLNHAVQPNMQDETRYSLAFNTWPEAVGGWDRLNLLDVNKLID
jgi:uncharacterized protein (TIGR02466 family)